MDYKVIKNMETVLRKAQVINTILFYNHDKKMLSGGSVYLSTSKDMNGVLYTNGVSIELKHKVGNKCVNYFFNKGYSLPYCKGATHEELVEAKSIFTSMCKSDELIARRYKAVKYILNNYVNIAGYYLKLKDFSLQSLHHDCTRKLLEAGTEVSASSNFKDITLNNVDGKDLMTIAHNIRRLYYKVYPHFSKLCYKEQMKTCLKKAWCLVKEADAKNNVNINEPCENNVSSPARKKELSDMSATKNKNIKFITFKPGYYMIEDCSNNILKECKELANIKIASGLLKDLDIKYTEEVFSKYVLSKVPKNFIIKYHTKAAFDFNDGHTYVKA